MGEAGTGLPDPLEKQGAAAGGGADDLLSQLAGDEIDRMLAEADVEATPLNSIVSEASSEAPVAAESSTESAAETTAATETTTAEATSGLQAQLDEVFNALTEAPAPEAAAPSQPAAVEAVPVEEAVAATKTENAAKDASGETSVNLDDQLAKLAQELLPASASEQAMTPVDATAETVTEAAAPVKAVEAVAATEAPRERAALLEQTAAEDGEEAELGGTAWYLWPLLWINAPFAQLSDQARALLGKVALATLLFSITVLTFVVMTRHRL